MGVDGTLDNDNDGIIDTVDEFVGVFGGLCSSDPPSTSASPAPVLPSVALPSASRAPVAPSQSQFVRQTPLPDPTPIIQDGDSAEIEILLSCAATLCSEAEIQEFITQTAEF